MWRAPEGPEGTGGLRDAAPSEARSPSLAGGRGLRRLEHPWGHKHRRNTGGAQQELLAREAVDLVHDEAAYGAHPRDGCDTKDAGTPGPHLQEVLETVAGSW